MNEVKDIIAHFINVHASKIVDSTKMDYTVVDGSILLHRMYSKLAESGYIIEDPSSISTYGDFVKALSGHPIIDKNNIQSDEEIGPTSNEEYEIGIDIENISNFRPSKNYSSEQFYSDNFGPSEIQYCEGKKDPIKSFASLFALKEAIVKADNSYRNKKFNTINIARNNSGKPIHPNFYLSTSHSDEMVVSVAVKYLKHQDLYMHENNEFEIIRIATNLIKSNSKKYFTKMQIFLFNLISIITLLIIFHYFVR